ncbi:MAG: hypothetical protein M9952_14420 [Microthrixaceae bacterium]|nr:hypothetical protein [Microthrixaceae bacterium]MCO5314117.1 hypothetical protein [Microthrixaceae bacterium]HPB46718.1 hypothetical protein [Microthrixaceae bacterium]
MQPVFLDHRLPRLAHGSLLLIAAVALVMGAVGWVALGAHPLSGPILVNLNSHRGIHITDILAAVPLGVALALSIEAWRVIRP